MPAIFDQQHHEQKGCRQQPVAPAGIPAQVAGFAAIVFANLALILSVRSRLRAIFETMRAPNPALWRIFEGTLAALAAALYVPAVTGLFHFAPLRPEDLALAVLAGAAGVAWHEGFKLIGRRRVS